MGWRIGLLVVGCAVLSACGADDADDGAGPTVLATMGTVAATSMPTTDSAPRDVSTTSTQVPLVDSTTVESLAAPTSNSIRTSTVPTTVSAIEFRPLFECGAGSLIGSTPPTQPPPESGGEVLGTADGLQVCLVGPVGANQDTLDTRTAEAELNQENEWVVMVDVRPEAGPIWDEVAGHCFQGDPNCPTHQIAIVVDDVIQSAPYVQTPNLPGSIQISGAFTEEQARALAATIKGM